MVLSSEIDAYIGEDGLPDIGHLTPYQIYEIDEILNAAQWEKNQKLINDAIAIGRAAITLLEGVEHNDFPE